MKFRKDMLQSAVVDTIESDALPSAKRLCRKVNWSRECASSSLWSRRPQKAFSDAELNKMRHKLRISMVSDQEVEYRDIQLDPVPILLVRRTVVSLSKSLKAPPEATASWILFAPSSYGVNLLRCLGNAIIKL